MNQPEFIPSLDNPEHELENALAKATSEINLPTSIGLTDLSLLVEAYLGLKPEVWFATPGRARTRVDTHFSINVNLADTHLRQSGLPQRILLVLQKYGPEGSQFNLEITESSVIGSHDGVTEVLEQLRDLEICPHLNDFGTGYSSLSYLQRLPIHTLKIDQSFLRSIEHQRDREIVGAVVGLAKALELKVVCEGIETLEHHEWLRGLGCPCGQGYFYARPGSADTIRDLLGRDLLDLRRKCWKWICRVRSSIHQCTNGALKSAPHMFFGLSCPRVSSWFVRVWTFAGGLLIDLQLLWVGTQD